MSEMRRWFALRPKRRDRRFEAWAHRRGGLPHELPEGYLLKGSSQRKPLHSQMSHWLKVRLDEG